MFCNRSSTWRRPRRPPVIRTAADALEVVVLAMSRPLRSETIAFLVDDAGVGTTVLIARGTVEPDTVVDVVEQVVAAGAGSGASGVVVASVRPYLLPPGEATALAVADVDRWLEASDVAAEGGLELLEWFVVDPQGARCPRELFGEPPRWSCP